RGHRRSRVARPAGLVHRRPGTGRACRQRRPGHARRGGARMTFLFDLLAAMFRNATPLVYGTTGETVTERSGVLNLGIEGTMYIGDFAGLALGFWTGEPLIGLVAAILTGVAAGAVMGFLTVT